jgi:hypothetical protein
MHGPAGEDPGTVAPASTAEPVAVEDPWPARRAALREREWATATMLHDLGEAILRRSTPAGSVRDALSLLRQGSEMGQRAVAMAAAKDVLPDSPGDDALADEDGPWLNVKSLGPGGCDGPLSELDCY